MTKALRLSPHELADQHRSGRVSIVDVREPMEFVGGHIPGSRNIPLGQLNKEPLPPEPMVLVCQSGARSERGVAALRSRGLATELADLEGGLLAWQAAQLPLAALDRPLRLAGSDAGGCGAGNLNGVATRANFKKPNANRKSGLLSRYRRRFGKKTRGIRGG
jgi:rhodanese-related sulfurtransferase